MTIKKQIDRIGWLEKRTGKSAGIIVAFPRDRKPGATEFSIDGGETYQTIEEIQKLADQKNLDLLVVEYKDRLAQNGV